MAWSKYTLGYRGIQQQELMAYTRAAAAEQSHAVADNYSCASGGSESYHLLGLMRYNEENIYKKQENNLL